ncbi:MAG TPA: hypothetical protein VJV03_20410 [Pyrinomonadaceae bacterium]|nr:hypothetical protein [Pyrinomonadaceae bacterium]
MPNDPGLAGDTCIFMEASAGDGGVHNSPVWWLSPDIILTGPVSGPDKADPGQVNPVSVKFHRKGAESNCIFPGSESITVELWVGNPSIAMTPNNPASAVKIAVIGSPTPLEGGTGTQIIDWVPPIGAPVTDPQSKGHKCLISRCYPDNLTPSNNSFFTPDDPHVAQRNICIVPCNAPGAARRPGPCGSIITTVNLNSEMTESVTLKATFDLNPDKFVRETVLRSLHGFDGFRQLARRFPRSFAFELYESPDAVINDRTKFSFLRRLFGGPRRYEATIKLDPGQLIRFNFSADLSGGKFGDAYIFHLTQVGSDRYEQGGLTLIMVA